MEANTTFVLTVIAPDRPGIVDDLSKVIADHGANWLQSRMAHLAGQFAGIVEVSVAPSRADTLRAALSRLTGSIGIQVHQARAVGVASDDGVGSGDQARTATLTFIGQEQAGIVQVLTSAMAAQGINVLEFDSYVANAPMSGEALFHATATVALPADVDLDALEAQLEADAGDMVVDLGFQD